MDPHLGPAELLLASAGPVSSAKHLNCSYKMQEKKKAQAK